MHRHETGCKAAQQRCMCLAGACKMGMWRATCAHESRCSSKGDGAASRLTPPSTQLAAGPGTCPTCFRLPVRRTGRCVDEPRAKEGRAGEEAEQRRARHTLPQVKHRTGIIILLHTKSRLPAAQLLSARCFSHLTSACACASAHCACRDKAKQVRVLSLKTRHV